MTDISTPSALCPCTPRLLTVGEVSALLHVDSRRVRKLIADGVLPSVRWTETAEPVVHPASLRDYIDGLLDHVEAALSGARDEAEEEGTES